MILLVIGIITSVVFDNLFHFEKNNFFWPTAPSFWPFFFNLKGLTRRALQGDLYWHGFVCIFQIYLVVCPDLFSHFSKQIFVDPLEEVRNRGLIKELKMVFSF